MTIKAIETRYNGYRFRSRLEARWAVFFDAVGIKYEYEKEGFDLGESGWYLPDFWLPQQEYWIEIKGQEPQRIELDKIIDLSSMTSDNTFLIQGDPWYFKPGVRTIYIGMSRGGVGWWDECAWCGKIFIKSIVDGSGLCARHKHVSTFLPEALRCLALDAHDLHSRYARGDIDKLNLNLRDVYVEALTYLNYYKINDSNNDGNIILVPKLSTTESKLEQAYRAARSARFEHGENGSNKILRSS